MALSWVWLGMMVVSIVCAVFTGRLDQLSAALLEGAGAAVTLCLSMTGVVCLWSGVMEVMRRASLLQRLARILRKPLCCLFPSAGQDTQAMESISANVSANLLGLGNAATPLGLAAAQRLHALSGRDGVASHELCLLVIVNTASLQIIPATIAGVRAAQGAAQPFDILPGVWLTSLATLVFALLLARVARGKKTEAIRCVEGRVKR